MKMADDDYGLIEGGGLGISGCRRRWFEERGGRRWLQVGFNGGVLMVMVVEEY
ncbi:hypothetical protein Hanom_Chr10g00967051 [Helianthus anomalus]